MQDTVKLTIQAFSDVITNSSSEVFIVTKATEGSDEWLREIIDELLRGADSDYMCDDLFDIKYDGWDLTITAKEQRAVKAANMLNRLKDLFEGWQNED